MALCLACVAATAFAAPAAMAAYVNTGHFADSGNFAGGGEHGQVGHPRRAVVDASTGNFLVADSENFRVEVFAPTDDTAEYLAQINVPEFRHPFGIAIDESGPTTVLYVSAGEYSGGNCKIYKYVSDGASVPTFTAAAGFTSPEAGGAVGQIENCMAALAVDPATGDFLVADPGDDLVKRFDSNGAFVSSFDGSTSPGGAFTGLLDMAVDSTGDIVVIDSPTGQVSDLVNWGSSRILRFDSSGAYQSTIGPVEGAGVLGIDPNTDDVYVVGNFASLHDEQPLHVSVFDSSDSPVEDFSMGPASEKDVGSGVAIAPGPAHRLYVVADIAEIFAGNMTIEVFEQPVPGLPSPVIEAPRLTPTTSTAKLEGTVDPHALQTTYWFEYGTTTAYGQSAPASHEGEAGSGIVAVPVGRFIGGLQANTTYHYRLVATNELGTSESADETFTTAPEPTPDTAQSSRGYELVSPAEKNNADVFALHLGARASESGDAVSFTSIGAFGDAESNAGIPFYLGRRGATGWSSTGLVPLLTTEAHAGIQYVAGLSKDLTKSVIATANRLTPDTVPGTNNLYLRDGATGDLTLLTGSGSFGEMPRFASASDDFSHIIFESTAQLTPGAPVPNTTPSGFNPANLYEWENGALRLVSVLPNGEPDANGGWAGIGAGAGSYLEDQHVVSADGSRIVWTDPTTGQIYLREDGTTTIRVSASQRGTPDPLGTGIAMFQRASADGSEIYFSSCEKLTDDSTAVLSDCPDASRIPYDSGGDLYRYDVESGHLADLSVSTTVEHASLMGMIGASEDGSYVYFASKGKLTADSESAPDVANSFERRPNIYRWHNGQLHYVTSMASYLEGQPDEDGNWTRTRPPGIDRLSRVSPDGRYLLLWSRRSLTGYDTNGTRQFYLYDAQDDSLVCVSCNANALRSENTADTRAPGNGAFGLFVAPVENRSLTPDGRVFFDTADPLVAADTNGQRDVYEWSNGAAHLISTGDGDVDAFFADASVDGSNVFFYTRDRLVGWDRDDNMDIYDAREGGGFPEPPLGPIGCEGDACQSPPSPPNDPSPSSATFEGAANPTPHFKARRHHRKYHRKKRHHANHARHATRSHG
ncbi:MAG TPA: NHL repeat-containing protein [Solirubrobacterales bacterium]